MNTNGNEKRIARLEAMVGTPADRAKALDAAALATVSNADLEVIAGLFDQTTGTVRPTTTDREHAAVHNLDALLEEYSGARSMEDAEAIFRRHYPGDVILVDPAVQALREVVRTFRPGGARE